MSVVRPVAGAAADRGGRVAPGLAGMLAGVLAAALVGAGCTRSYARIVALTSAQVTRAEAIASGRPVDGAPPELSVGPGAPASPVDPLQVPSESAGVAGGPTPAVVAAPEGTLMPVVPSPPTAPTVRPPTIDHVSPPVGAAPSAPSDLTVPMIPSAPAQAGPDLPPPPPPPPLPDPNSPEGRVALAPGVEVLPEDRIPDLAPPAMPPAEPPTTAPPGDALPPVVQPDGSPVGGPPVEAPPTLGSETGTTPTPAAPTPPTPSTVPLPDGVPIPAVPSPALPESGDPTPGAPPTDGGDAIPLLPPPATGAPAPFVLPPGAASPDGAPGAPMPTHVPTPAPTGVPSTAPPATPATPAPDAPPVTVLPPVPLGGRISVAKLRPGAGTDAPAPPAVPEPPVVPPPTGATPPPPSLPVDADLPRPPRPTDPTIPAVPAPTVPAPMDPPSTVPPPDDRPEPPGPNDPLVPTPPAVPPTDDPPTRPGAKGFEFGAPRAALVAKHVAALRANPDDGALACFPKDLARTVPAATALAKGERPVLVLFYDDTARSSRLAAADLWPVLLEVEANVDVVLVDLTPGPRRALSDDERRLVRRYYLGYVPTTVVLTSERTPRLLKSERVEPALVRAACLEAK